MHDYYDRYDYEVSLYMRHDKWYWTYKSVAFDTFNAALMDFKKFCGCLNPVIRIFKIDNKYYWMYKSPAFDTIDEAARHSKTFRGL